MNNDIPAGEIMTSSPIFRGLDHQGRPIYEEPSASPLADTQRAIIEAAERRGYERALADLDLDAAKFRQRQHESCARTATADTDGAMP